MNTKAASENNTMSMVIDEDAWLAKHARMKPNADAFPASRMKAML
jgi:hypothetical protein